MEKILYIITHVKTSRIIECFISTGGAITALVVKSLPYVQLTAGILSVVVASMTIISLNRNMKKAKDNN